MEQEEKEKKKRAKKKETLVDGLMRAGGRRVKNQTTEPRSILFFRCLIPCCLRVAFDALFSQES